MYVCMRVCSVFLCIYCYMYQYKIYSMQCMLWTDSAGERERVIRDLDVMVKHRSPHIVQYYGSQIIQKEVGVAVDHCVGVAIVDEAVA